MTIMKLTGRTQVMTQMTPPTTKPTVALSRQ